MKMKIQIEVELSSYKNWSKVFSATTRMVDRLKKSSYIHLPYNIEVVEWKHESMPESKYQVKKGVTL